MYLPGRIPISIHPWFWLFAGLIGWLNSKTLMGVVIWIGIIFVSVLFHEFGHALTALAFRQRVQIQLVALGGLTTFDGPKLSFPKQFLIVLNGPLAGILLFLIASALLLIPMNDSLFKILYLTRFVNLFWSIVNLLPVLPLDGGQLLRIALEGFFGVKGFKASLLIGMTISLLASFYFFLIQAFLAGAFFFLFAFQSFDAWRKSRSVVAADREDSVRLLLTRGEELLKKGDREGAKAIFEELRAKGNGGIISSAATQYLAFLYLEENRQEEAYRLLLPLKKDLSEEALCLLHQLADQEGDFALVAELSAECYQFSPTQEVALRNAKAFSALNQAEHAGGWLQTAWQHRPFEVQLVINRKEFAEVRDNPAFRDFIDRLR